jgi:carbamoyltransferase
MLTLGHHASAVYFDGTRPVGYEEERLNRVKSTSSYPRLSIAEIEKRVEIKKGSQVFVSHWFDRLDFHGESNKYFDKEHFDALVAKYSLNPVYLSEEFTHHDAHAWSAVSFLRDHKTNEFNRFVEVGDKFHVIAADGYGTSQEVFSVYELDASNKTSRPKLLNRYYGYEYSLGLMYQYATSFCGMKENQDEYKFLGYETHVEVVLNQSDISALEELARKRANDVFELMLKYSDARGKNWSNPDGLVNTALLAKTKENWHSIFGDVLNRFGVDNGSRAARIVIGHYIQELIEGVVLNFVDAYKIKHVALSGGIFYNVKLNNRVLNRIDGLFTVVPLAGDQGCGVGMYESYIGGFKWGDLKWGDRPSFSNWQSQLSSEDLTTYGRYIRYYSSSDRATAVGDTVSSLRENKLVNVVKSKMEYGPRALCSTTTLSIPTSSNVEIINDLNERDTVMPMAPVMLDSVCDELFDASVTSRVVGSDRYMILTYDYKNPDLKRFGGVAHKYPRIAVWSGRPQLIDETDTFMSGVLNGVRDLTPALINTSFNAHGRPIVYDFDSTFDSFKFECDKAKELGYEMPLLFLCDFDG